MNGEERRNLSNEQIWDLAHFDQSRYDLKSECEKTKTIVRTCIKAMGQVRGNIPDDLKEYFGLTPKTESDNNKNSAPTH